MYHRKNKKTTDCTWESHQIIYFKLSDILKNTGYPVLHIQRCLGVLTDCGLWTKVSTYIMVIPHELEICSVFPVIQELVGRSGNTTHVYFSLETDEVYLEMAKVFLHHLQSFSVIMTFCTLYDWKSICQFYICAHQPQARFQILPWDFSSHANSSHELMQVFLWSVDCFLLVC